MVSIKLIAKRLSCGFMRKSSGPNAVLTAVYGGPQRRRRAFFIAHRDGTE